MTVALHELSRFANQEKQTAICTIGFLDPENIVLVDTKITILQLCALAQKLWSKRIFAKWGPMLSAYI